MIELFQDLPWYINYGIVGVLSSALISISSPMIGGPKFTFQKFVIIIPIWPVAAWFALWGIAFKLLGCDSPDRKD